MIMLNSPSRDYCHLQTDHPQLTKQTCSLSGDARVYNSTCVQQYMSCSQQVVPTMNLKMHRLLHTCQLHMSPLHFIRYPLPLSCSCVSYPFHLTPKMNLMVVSVEHASSVLQTGHDVGNLVKVSSARLGRNMCNVTQHAQ
jgi:hypothetical protein